MSSRDDAALQARPGLRADRISLAFAMHGGVAGAAFQNHPSIATVRVRKLV